VDLSFVISTSDILASWPDLRGAFVPQVRKLETEVNHSDLVNPVAAG
jgi:hypothetical protein